MSSPDLATEMLHSPALMFKFFLSVPTVKELPEVSTEGTLLRTEEGNFHHYHLWVNDQWYCFKP